MTVKHGIEEHGDGPYGFTGPALVNTIYGRWWHPLDEKAGPNPVPNSPLPWTGDFKDGLGNKISMMAYANPEDRSDEKKRADGYGLARFNKKTRQITFECWPRFCDVSQGDKAHCRLADYGGSGRQRRPRGRRLAAHLQFAKGVRPEVQVIEDATGEVLNTTLAKGETLQPRVYSKGKHTVKIGRQKPDRVTVNDLEPKSKKAAGTMKVAV